LILTSHKRFLYLISLRTATSLIALNLVINKAPSIYGLLAPFTGHPLSALQLSMYIYSLPILILAVYLTTYLRRTPPSPLHTIAFAWLYALDSLVNIAYTAAFGVAWFMLLSSGGDDGANKVPGGKMMDGTSGATSPAHNVSGVDIIASPHEGVQPGQGAVVVPHPGNTSADLPVGLGGVVFQSGSITSVTLISALWALRIYSVLVVLSYARMVLRQHVAQSTASSYELHTGAASEDMAQNPFAEGRELGSGWQGKLGRLLVGGFSKRYWLGRDEGEDAEWMKSMGGKFGGRKVRGAALNERERRRRSGTGPMEPIELPQFQGQVGS